MRPYSQLHFCIGADEKVPMVLAEHPQLPHFMLTIGHGEAQFTLSGPKNAVRAAVRELAALFDGRGYATDRSPTDSSQFGTPGCAGGSEP